MKRLHLFEGFGIELEYMIVSRETLAVLPVADTLLRNAGGETVNELRRGRVRWSNELVLHVLELKTHGPAPQLAGLAEEFTHQVREVNRLLEPLEGLLLPTAMHPWMNPFEDTRLWPHDNSPIYSAYNRIFDCRGHGWSNLQSTHLNLPFCGDDEFGRLHAAIRLVLPLIPALASSSPVLDGHTTGLLDNRLEVYRLNQRRIPSITGQVIPEGVFTRRAYRQTILKTIYRDIAPHDPEKVLQEEWLNSRGAIARFERNAIEIRLLDVQETPFADLAIIELLTATLRELIAETHAGYLQQQLFDTPVLEQHFLDCVQRGDKAVIDNASLLQAFGLDRARCTAGEIWRQLDERLLPRDASPTRAALDVLLSEGPLARRILRRLGSDFDRDDLQQVYAELGSCLASGRTFRA